MKTILLWTIILVTSCQPSNKTSFVITEKVLRTEARYKEKYGTFQYPVDTVVTKGRLYIVYKQGVLNEIGEYVSGNKTGVWYYFDDSLKLAQIIRFRKGYSDTIAHPHLTINDKW